MTTMMPVEEERSMTDTIVVRDETGKNRSFAGRLILDLSWETSRLPRWTDMVLYEKDDGTYVLLVVARSVVYHRKFGGCRKGVPMSAGILYDNQRERYDELKPCEDCTPVDLRSISDDDIDATVIKVEEDWSKVHECSTAEDLLDALRNKGDGSFSGLAMRMLQGSARLDPGIAALMDASEPM